MEFIMAPSKCCKHSKKAKLKGWVLKCKEAIITQERNKSLEIYQLRTYK